MLLVALFVRPRLLLGLLLGLKLLHVRLLLLGDGSAHVHVALILRKIP